MQTLILTATLLLCAMMTVNAQDVESRSRTVSVDGQGKVTRAPDMATVRFNVVTRDLDAEVARSANAEASREALNVIRGLGIDEDKIRLDHLSLAPVREWDQEQRRHIDVGFEVNRGVSVELDDLDLVPTVVARIVQSGANRIQSVQYGLSDYQDAQLAALTEAVENARSKATAMLQALEEPLGRVIEVREQSVNVPSPIMRAYATSAMEKGADPAPEAYAPGLIEVSAQVTATFAIE